MSEFELGDDGELFCKHAADSERILRAMKLAIAKNADNDCPQAFDPASDEEEEAEADQGDQEEEAERVRAARARRRQRLIEASRESARLASTKRKALTMDDLTAVADTLCKSADAKTISKLAAAEVNAGASLFSSFERASMLGAIAKVHGQGGGSDAQILSRFLQNPDNRLLLKWSLLHADTTALAKRDTLLDDTVAKVSSPGAAPAIGGRTAFAVRPGAAKTEADKQRDAEIERQMRSGRWQSVEEAARYVDGLDRELERMARAKQERARPGTLDRV
jgi:hypothetical protein